MMLEELPTIQDLIRGWYFHYGKNERQHFFRFLCLWICINAWMQYKSDKTNDSEMIKWLISDAAANSDLRRSYYAMSVTTVGGKYLDALASQSPIQDARGDRPDIFIADKNDYANVIRGIYRIRCNLFHGGKDSRNSRDRKLVMCANEILNKWIGELINTWV